MAEREPLTILHLVSLLGWGGRCATAMRQARLLAARGHRVLLGCLPGALAAQRGRELGLEVHDCFTFRRGFRPLTFWRDCRTLAALCRDAHVDILHTHLSQETWAAAATLHLLRRPPVFIRSRGVVVPVKPSFFNRLLHNRLSANVVAPSAVIADALRALPGFDPARVVLIEDGVDITRFSPANDGAGARAEFGIPADAPLAVMVARLERVKGHEFFFRALAKVARSNAVPGLRALCACDERTPGAFDAAVKQARELGCPPELLSFTGMRADVERILAAADVVALPSLGSEGSSRVALEAGAAGRPVVASAVGCLPEVLPHGETGLIVPPGDADALAAGLAELLNDRARAQKLGRAARARVEQRYDEQVMVRRLEELYTDALQRRR